MPSRPRPRAAISWSGGKDSCSALQRVRSRFDVVSMVTMFDEEGARSRSHGLRPDVIAAQASRLGLRLVPRRCSWSTYAAAFADALQELRGQGVSHVIFGDIMFEEHRRWAETICASAALEAVEPIWGEPTEAIFLEFLAAGGEATIVTVRDDLMDPSWLGRQLTVDMLEELRTLGVDPCGERGEYHTLVTNSPLFSRRLEVRQAGRVSRASCWGLDVELAASDAVPGGAHAISR